MATIEVIISKSIDCVTGYVHQVFFSLQSHTYQMTWGRDANGWKVVSRVPDSLTVRRESGQTVRASSLAKKSLSGTRETSWKVRATKED